MYVRTCVHLIIYGKFNIIKKIIKKYLQNLELRIKEYIFALLSIILIYIILLDKYYYSIIFKLKSNIFYRK